MKPAAPLTDAQIEATLRETGRMEDPPAAVLREAIAIWRPRKAQAAEPWPHRLARLVFDSLGSPELAFGLRAGVPAARQMVFSEEALDIELAIEPAEGLWRLRGQLLGEILAAGGQARLLHEDSDPAAGTSAAEAALTEAFEFHLLPAVPDGRYRLVLQLPEKTIELPILVLGAAER